MNRKTAKIRPCGFESVRYFQKLRERERMFFFCKKTCLLFVKILKWDIKRHLHSLQEFYNYYNLRQK